METDPTEATVEEEIKIRYAYPESKEIIQPEDSQQAKHLNQAVRQYKKTILV